MKKNIINLVLAFLLSSTIFAQKIILGPEIGVNLINTESTYLGSNFQLGYHFGASAKYYFNEKFAISSGIFLTQKKKQYSFIDTTTTPDPLAGIFNGFTGGTPSNTNTDAEVYTTTTGMASELYLQLPLLANYEFKKINIYAGPYVGLLLSVNKKETYTRESTATDISSFIPGGLGGFSSLLDPTANQPTTGTSNSKDGLAPFDFGASAGIGYRVDQLNFNLFYTYGFLDYRKDRGDKSIETHQIIRFSISYFFNLSGSKGMKDRYNLDVE